MTSELCGALPEELRLWLESIGERSFRVDQILSWVHKKGVLDPASMTNLSKSLREKLETDWENEPATIGDVACSSDGTRKLRFDFKAGGAVETVLIPEGDKLTQCISTQVGCAFRCRFCLSGSRGLERNLTTGEIMAQIVMGRAHWEENERLTNIVVMGSGEPLANFDATAAAVRLLTDDKATGLSTRRVTVSTIGLPKGIERLGREFDGQIGLAVSLHGPDDETRGKLLPKLNAVKTDAVIRALKAYPLPQRRRITIEYTMIDGLNDSVEHAKKLAKTLAGLKVKLNLIPFNLHIAADLNPSPPERIEAFQQTLIDKGYTVIIRKERGADIGAACGQLIAKARLKAEG